MALIGISIRIALEVGKPKSCTVRKPPNLLCIVELGAERRVDLLGSLDRLDQLNPRPAKHDADCILAVARRVLSPLAKHPVRLAATSGATEEDLKRLAVQ